MLEAEESEIPDTKPDFHADRQVLNTRSYCTTLRKTIMKQAIWKNAR
jgi:hypothetical protein